MSRSVRPVLTPTQARFLLSAARRAKAECKAGDERRTWAGAYRALSVAIQEMRAAGRVVCDYCSSPHPLNDDGTKCKFPRPAPEDT